MSRIEEALEKAAMLRKAPEVSGPPVPKTSPPPLRGLAADVEPLVPVHSCLNPQENNPVAGEEYRKLGSRVVQLTCGPPFRNTLLLTSAEQGEGKTVSALNLSMALAREYDYTVLLVDADLRKPSVHQYLGIEPEVGLIQVLKGETTLERALVKTGLGNLVVLPAGGTVPDPVELLSSRRMKEIVQELKHRYPERYIVFDSPPAFPFADARVLSGVVDGVLFVIREGWGRVGQVRETLGFLEEAQLLGLIYNNASLVGEQGRYQYY